MLIAGRGDVFSEGLVLGHPWQIDPRGCRHGIVDIAQQRQQKERPSRRTTRSREVGQERVRIEGRGCIFSTEEVQTHLGETAPRVHNRVSTKSGKGHILRGGAVTRVREAMKSQTEVRGPASSSSLKG